MRATRDLTRALGNPTSYNPSSPYLPPGVPPGFLERSPADACKNPVVLKKFFDKNYNPDGSRDVITFCDGNDSTSSGLGVFDPNMPESDPTQILLAVDLNQNGQRDSGEPVIVQGSEPFQDVGLDGLADAQEPGYDPVNNPDPNGDDYHYLWNPTGTEGNWRYDAGEPFEDVGIDGVAMSLGGCPARQGPGCYDYGEGNGKFDYSPWQANWRKHDPRANLEALDPSAFDRFDVYYDAGIRDFFNAHVSTNALMGALGAQGQAVRSFEGFPALLGLAPSREHAYDVNKVDFTTLGRHVFVRYGDPDTAEALVEQTGDGRHVGTAEQAVHRAQTMLYWLAWRWPDGDRKIPADSTSRTVNETIEGKGRSSPYVVVLPPGYDSPDQANVTYPVVYIGHGLGMHPEDLGQITVLAQSAMLDAQTPEAKRMPKMIMVILDGVCRPEMQDVSHGPVDSKGDLCEEGTFYTDHPEGPYQGEQMILQVEDAMAAKYRVRPEADVMVTE
jgi:hypothetical protein